MKKNEFNQIIRDYAKNHLSPRPDERALVSDVYDAIKKAIGNSCLLVGSFARFTAITPLHDVDILFIDGNYDPNFLNPLLVLQRLQTLIRQRFVNPTTYSIEVSLQSHSITISFQEHGKEVFAADIVPAYVSGLKNEFNDSIYYVPQILNTNRRNRQKLYETLSKQIKNESEWWILSDPKGYIHATTMMNVDNNDFRKVSKFVKLWKHKCKDSFPDFKLKSFHIEQVVFNIFKQNIKIEMIDAIFRFFCKIPDIIRQPQIRDRADNTKFIDDYIAALSHEDKNKIMEARDKFLIDLEGMTRSQQVSSLLCGEFYSRACMTEEYLFDSGIGVFIEDDLEFQIDGIVLPKDGFRGNWWLSSKGGVVEKNRKIRFTITENTTNADLYKWKVKNDNASQQPRGEITNHRTLNDPESTQYSGNHYVECYAISNGVCIAKSKRKVVIP